MKKIFITMLLSISTLTTFAQNASTERYTTHNKGKFFFYWGGNRAYYTNSDITFSGNNYNFTIKDVEAVDKPKGWHIDYINPLRMTIPQTNFHIGYHISDHYTISAGVDHMKYVMKNGQTVKMNGYINGSNTSHDGTYNNTDKLLSEDFLTFEHTDGLNYVVVEGARIDDISRLFGIRNTDILQVNLTEGLGFGALYPRTNTKLLNKERYDEFHIAGTGVNAKAGLHLTFFKYFLIVGELKGGYINMYDVRTTYDIADKSKHDFFFFETVLGIGGTFRF